jgi:hypothetical protein
MGGCTWGPSWKLAAQSAAAVSGGGGAYYTVHTYDLITIQDEQVKPRLVKNSLLFKFFSPAFSPSNDRAEPF